MREIVGNFDASGLSFGIAVSRFNDRVSEGLLAGALDALTRHGAEEQRVILARVPGSFELPQALRAIASGPARPDALIALGALIRGETPHFDHLAASVTRALLALSGETGLPVANGVLTCDTPGQALERSGGKAGNKGFEAAMSAIEMARLLRQLSRG